MASNSLKELVLTAPVRRGSRGRNGLLTASRVQVYARAADGGTAGFVSVDAYSHKEAKAPPIALGLSLEDAVLLAETILQAVADTLHIRRCPACGDPTTEVYPTDATSVVCATCATSYPRWSAVSPEEDADATP